MTLEYEQNCPANAESCSRCLTLATREMRSSLKDKLPVRAIGLVIENSGLVPLLNGEDLPQGSLAELSCLDRQTRAISIAHQLANTTLRDDIPKAEAKQTDKMAALYDKIRAASDNPELQEIAEQSGPLTENQLPEHILSSERFQTCNERYGWPQSSDQVLTTIEEQYPNMVHDKNSFLRLLLGSGQLYEGEPRAGFGSFLDYFTGEPLDTQNYDITVPGEMQELLNTIRWKPVFHRAMTIMPELMSALREARDAYNATKLYDNPLRNFQDMLTETMHDDSIGNALYTVFRIMQRLVADMDNNEEFRYGPESVKASTNRVYRLLCM